MQDSLLSYSRSAASMRAAGAWNDQGESVDALYDTALHAFIEEPQRAPKAELDLAKARKTEFLLKGS